jgi:hypothetical protein
MSWRGSLERVADMAISSLQKNVASRKRQFGSHVAAQSAAQNACSIARGSDGVCEPTPPVIARKAVGIRFIDDHRMHECEIARTSQLFYLNLPRASTRKSDLPRILTAIAEDSAASVWHFNRRGHRDTELNKEAHQAFSVSSVLSVVRHRSHAWLPLVSPGGLHTVQAAQNLPRLRCSDPRLHCIAAVVWHFDHGGHREH